MSRYLILGRNFNAWKLRNVFIGNRLESAGETDEDHLLSKSQALAMLSSDALSSIAYGPEQVILVFDNYFCGGNLVVFTNWTFGFGIVSKPNDFLPTSYPCLP